MTTKLMLGGQGEERRPAHVPTGGGGVNLADQVLRQAAVEPHRPGVNDGDNANGARDMEDPQGRKLPNHFVRLMANLQDVRQLLAAHEQIAGAGRGRKRDVEVLNKSAIVLLVACWEVYVEDVVESALTVLMEGR